LDCWDAADLAPAVAHLAAAKAGQDRHVADLSRHVSLSEYYQACHWFYCIIVILILKA
jgi:hypothetical protein